MQYERIKCTVTSQTKRNRFSCAGLKPAKNLETPMFTKVVTITLLWTLVPLHLPALLLSFDAKRPQSFLPTGYHLLAADEKIQNKQI